MKNFEESTQTISGAAARDIKFNNTVNMYIGYVWDKESYRPDDKWTTCVWSKNGHCINRNRPEFDLI